MHKQLEKALEIQRTSWNAGHENYGASIDIEAVALEILQYFKHLNPVQKALEAELALKDELKYAKPVSNFTHKAIRSFIIHLK